MSKDDGRRVAQVACNLGSRSDRGALSQSPQFEQPLAALQPRKKIFLGHPAQNVASAMEEIEGFV